MFQRFEVRWRLAEVALHAREQGHGEEPHACREATSSRNTEQGQLVTSSCYFGLYLSIDGLNTMLLLAAR